MVFVIKLLSLRAEWVHLLVVYLDFVCPLCRYSCRMRVLLEFLGYSSSLIYLSNFIFFFHIIPSYTRIKHLFLCMLMAIFFFLKAKKVETLDGHHSSTRMQQILEQGRRGAGF